MELNKIVKGSKKSEGQKSAINKFKTLYKLWEKVIKLFDESSRIVSEAKYKARYGEGLKILTLKQMFQRLAIALAQVKAGNASDYVFNENRQIIYSLYREKEIIKKWM